MERSCLQYFIEIGETVSPQIHKSDRRLLWTNRYNRTEKLKTKWYQYMIMYYLQLLPVTPVICVCTSQLAFHEWLQINKLHASIYFLHLFSSFIFYDSHQTFYEFIANASMHRLLAESQQVAQLWQRPHELGDFKKVRVVNGRTENDSLKDSHKRLHCRWQNRIIW